MKQFLYILGLSIMLSGIFSSCKPDSLTVMHEDEVAAREQFIKTHNLDEYKDDSGIYFKDSIIGTGDIIKSGYQIKMVYKITLLNGKAVFSNLDEYGHNYEEHSFYVDVSNDIVNQSPVQQIAGLHKGFKKMRIGGRAFMVIPSELAFQALDYSSTYGIPRFSTLLATIYAKDGFSPEEQKEQQQQ
jgi:FKBP-type peptidyl-prolyl cis-trans isomerase